MARITEHAPKVSTRSVKPNARKSSWEKRQQDKQTDGKTDRRIVQITFLDVLRVVQMQYIPNAVLSQSLLFVARCQNFHGTWK